MFYFVFFRNVFFVSAILVAETIKTPRYISSERLKLQTSNFVHRLATRSTNIQMTNCPLVSVVGAT